MPSLSIRHGYGCATGTSCNGGVNFDNRLSCEPSLSLDVCGPLPTCGIVGQMASDIWFKFYPTFPNVTLACVQNTSLVIGIQAFQGNSCGTITPLGCAVAAGPSSGVQLNLTGLNPMQLYYFRIYGASHSNPQRTGLYCFCGTQGLNSTVLPTNLQSLKAIGNGGQVELSFDKPERDDEGTYEIEYSLDGITFQPVYKLISQGLSATSNKIVFTHSPQNTESVYYRLKRSLANGRYHLQ